MLIINGLSYYGPIITNTFLLMSLLFFPVLIMILYSFKDVLKIFLGVDKRILFVLFLVFLFGFWLRNSEYRYGLNVDGIYYAEMAKSISEQKLLTQGCAAGTMQDCKFFYGAVVLPGYPYLISLLFKIFGTHDLIAMVISGVSSSLTIILVFLVFFILFRSQRGALFAAAIFSVSPLDIYVAHTAAVRPVAIFFMCLALLYYFLAVQKNKIIHWVSAALCLSYAVYIRLEFYLLLIPIFIYFGYSLWKKEKTIKNLSYFLLFLLIFLIHQLIALNWLINSNFGLTGGSHPTFSLAYISAFPKIFKYFFVPHYQPDFFLFIPFISILFILGVLFSFRRENYSPEVIFVLILLSTFLLSITLFFRGSDTGEGVRYLQLIIVPYSITAAWFADRILKKIKSSRGIFLGIGLTLLFSMPFFKENIKLSLFKDGRLGEKIVRGYYDIYLKLPKNVLLFTYQPQVFNFDFMRTKGIRIASYGQNQLEEYIGYKQAFIKEIKEYGKLRWFFIPMACETNKFCAIAREAGIIEVPVRGTLGLYEIINKDYLLKKIEGLF